MSCEIEKQVAMDEPEESDPFLTKNLSPSFKIQGGKVVYTGKILQLELEIDQEVELKKSKTSLNSKTNQKGWRQYAGLIYCLISTNLFALNSTLMKTVSHIHPFNVTTFTFPLSALLTIPFILYTVCYEKKSVLTGVLPLCKNKKTVFFLWFRSVLTVSVVYLLIITFKYISVADTRTIIASSVITVHFLGWLFLGEKTGWVPILTAVLALLGIGVMTRPPMFTGAESFDNNTLIGVVLAIVVMLVATIVIISVRFLQHIHHGFINCFLYTWGAGQSLILGLAFGVFEFPQSGKDTGMLCLMGVVYVMAHTFLVLALQVEEAGVVALIRTSEVIFTYCWQMIIVGVYPDTTSMVGAALVVTGVVVVSARKWLSSLPENNRNRKRFGFLLK